MGTTMLVALLSRKYKRKTIFEKFGRFLRGFKFRKDRSKTCRENQKKILVFSSHSTSKMNDRGRESGKVKVLQKTMPNTCILNV